MRRRTVGLTLALALVAIGALVACPSARPPYHPHDRSLASLPLFFYPSRTTEPPSAVLVFFGNDVGFWKAHDELANRLAGDGYDVIGVDVKKYIDRLPSSPAARTRAFGPSIVSIITRAVAELHAQSLPLVIGGHSYGADLALWTAAHAPPPRLTGVLALSPTARSHFYVTMTDLANLKDPSEPGSFSIADQIRVLPSSLRVALLRGDGDRRRAIDSTLCAAGGGRVRYTVIPFAGHSLKSLTIAGPMIASALDWIVAR